MRKREEPDFISPPHRPIEVKATNRLVDAIANLDVGMAITVSPYRWDMVGVANGYGKTCSPRRRYRTRQLEGNRQQVERIE